MKKLRTIMYCTYHNIPMEIVDFNEGHPAQGTSQWPWRAKSLDGSINQAIPSVYFEPIKLSNPVIINEDYRGRWSELPEGEYDFKKNDIVNLEFYPGIGSYTLTRQDGTEGYIHGFGGYIIEKIKTNIL